MIPQLSAVVLYSLLFHSYALDGSTVHAYTWFGPPTEPCPCRCPCPCDVPVGSYPDAQEGRADLPLSTRPTSVCEARRGRYGTPLRARGRAKGAHRAAKRSCLVGRGWRLALADGAVDSVRFLETMPRERAILRIFDTSQSEGMQIVGIRMLSHAQRLCHRPLRAVRALRGSDAG